MHNQMPGVHVVRSRQTESCSDRAFPPLLTRSPAPLLLIPAAHREILEPGNEPVTRYFVRARRDSNPQPSDP